MRVALVTSKRLPEEHWRDIDAEPLGAALTARGVHVERAAWDSAQPVDWAGFDVLVAQSPWSMWLRTAEFRDWLAAREAAGDRLLNPADVLRLGSDKRYLVRLAAAGVATVPTTLLDPGAGDAELRDAVRRSLPPAGLPRRTVVVKPISAGGALGIGEFPADRLDAAVAHARALLTAGGGALAQPYVAAIDHHRELAVIMLNGRVSHALTKAAILRPGTAARAFHPDPRPYALSPAQEAVALAVHDSFLRLRPPQAPPVYSVRLDFLIDPATEPGLHLLEIEAVAPVKFLPLFPGRAASFARTIVELA